MLKNYTDTTLYIMPTITRSILVRHDNAQLLGGLLHYIQAGSNHAAKGYRRGIRGKELYEMARHRTEVYQSRFAAYIVRDIYGSHKAWRTHQMSKPHARAPHYTNPVAQTDRFEMAFGQTAKRWNGSPAIHVAIYGRGRKDRKWMSFEVPPYVVERLSKTDITPKTIRIGRDTIWITYEEHIEDKEPVTWAGVDMNSNNNTYAFPDGTIIRRDNDYTKQYNAVHSKICRVKRRGDKRIMGKYAGKAWRTYKNRIKDHTRKEAHWLASRGVGIGYEQLAIHKLYNKQNGMAPPTRGRMSTTLNVGQRKRAHVNATESKGLPHEEIDPHGTSAKCFKCGQELKRSVSWCRRERNMWCQGCKAIRERDCNAGANILFRTIFGLVVAATGWNMTGKNPERKMSLYDILALLKEALLCLDTSSREYQTLSNIMRLLEGRSADTQWRLLGANWCLSGAHKPGRRSLADGELVGDSGVGGLGRNGPGPPNVAKLCEYA